MSQIRSPYASRPIFARKALSFAVLAALSTAFAPSAHALALGRATVQSGLGEPLRVRIDVPSITAEEASSLQVSLASPDTFRAANMEYNPAMGDVTMGMEPVVRGATAIVVTGQSPINEPFIDMVLEAKWSNGRLVRGYTMLLGAVKAPPPPLPTPVLPQNAAAAAAPAPAAPVVATQALPPVSAPAPRAPTTVAAAPSAPAAVATPSPPPAPVAAPVAPPAPAPAPAALAPRLTANEPAALPPAYEPPRIATPQNWAQPTVRPDVTMAQEVPTLKPLPTRQSTTPNAPLPPVRADIPQLGDAPAKRNDTATGIQPLAALPARPALAPAAPAAPVAPPVTPLPAAPTVKPAPKPPVPAKQPAARDDTAVRVKRGDTAGALARQYKTQDISLDQMMVAMLRANPNAFINNNVNRMKSGVVLDMPSSAEAAAIDATEARRAIAAQIKDFNAYRQRLASVAPTSPSEQTNTRDAKGQVQAEVNDQAPQAAASDRLTLSKGKVESKAEADMAQAKQKAEDQQRTDDISRNIKDLQAVAEQTTPPGATPVATEGDGTTQAQGNSSDGGVNLTPAVPTEPAVQATVAPAPAPVEPPAEPAKPHWSEQGWLIPAGVGLLLTLGGLAAWRLRRAKPIESGEADNFASFDLSNPAAEPSFNAALDDEITRFDPNPVNEPLAPAETQQQALDEAVDAYWSKVEAQTTAVDTPPAPQAMTEDDVAQRMNLHSIDLNLNPPGAPEVPPETDDDAAFFDDQPLTTDEDAQFTLEAKLSLAEEFLSVGDPVGAKSLAAEVLKDAKGDLRERALAFMAQVDNA